MSCTTSHSQQPQETRFEPTWSRSQELRAEPQTILPLGLCSRMNTGSDEWDTSQPGVLEQLSPKRQLST